TDFLARAKALGYVVPDAALDKAYDALTPVAVQENGYSTGYNVTVYQGGFNQDTTRLLVDRSSAYAINFLARGGRMAGTRQPYRHKYRLARIASPLPRAQIGTALYMIGDNARARSAFDKAEGALGYQTVADYSATPRRDLAGV